jgi:hypothetical protein
LDGVGVGFANAHRWRRAYAVEGADELLGVGRTDASDHAGGGYFSISSAEVGGEKLLAVCAIVDPFAGRCDPLMGCNSGRMTDNGHDIPMPPRRDPDNAKAILDIMILDPLDQASLRRCFRRTIQGERPRRVLSSDKSSRKVVPTKIRSRLPIPLCNRIVTAEHVESGEMGLTKWRHRPHGGSALVPIRPDGLSFLTLRQAAAGA